MTYIISINKPNKKCIIHESGCSSIGQVLKGKSSPNQEYIKAGTCGEVKRKIKEKNLLDCTRCQKCNPDCP